MSSYVLVTFYNKDKKLDYQFYFNSLKELLSGWSWCDELEQVYCIKDKINNEIIPENGDWFNYNSFETALLKFKNQLNNYKLELNRCNKLRDSIDYYKLNPEQQQSLLDDISMYEDLVENNEFSIYLCKFMMDQLIIVSDNNDCEIDDCYVNLYLEC